MAESLEPETQMGQSLKGNETVDYHLASDTSQGAPGSADEAPFPGARGRSGGFASTERVGIGGFLETRGDGRSVPFLVALLDVEAGRTPIPVNENKDVP